MSKKIRFLVEIPENWVDLDSPTLWKSRTIRDEVEEMIKKILIQECVMKTKLPNIKIDKGEVKDRILTILAERALANNEKSNIKTN